MDSSSGHPEELRFQPKRRTAMIKPALLSHDCDANRIVPTHMEIVQMVESGSQGLTQILKAGSHEQRGHGTKQSACM